eukprot:TRINITY_DN4459_c0_g1_i2.p1 TRINITY_DN4459_c0_g1~~TRINITY_DN4459_c0_g1_i2.p1  ORF type:complete len:433 (+),score=100.16 TRINITY_DN4459_c0_g1_i2:140-1438(+)
MMASRFAVHSLARHTRGLAAASVRSSFARNQAVRAFGSSVTASAYRKLPVNTIINFVPKGEAWVIERMGRYLRTNLSGPTVVIPFLESIKYVHSLKMQTMEISEQEAITSDNVMLRIDGVVYYRVVDAHDASYNIEDYDYAIHQLSISTLRSEIGKLTLEQCFQERATLNQKIVDIINNFTTGEEYGLQCLRYEMRDITPPRDVLKAMERQVTAERKRREYVILSLGEKESAINKAEGKKKAEILESEARMQKIINENRGEAEAIRTRAEFTAQGLKQLAEAIGSPHGREAVSLRVAEQYVEAFGKIAKEGNTILLPANASDPSSMVAQAMAVYNNISYGKSGASSKVINAPVAEGGDHAIGHFELPNGAEEHTNALGDASEDELIDAANRELGNPFGDDNSQKRSFSTTPAYTGRKDVLSDLLTGGGPSKN